MNYLFLSPHYDDAIYSCGGTIYDLTQSGHEVEILTVMAGLPDLPLLDTPVLKDNHQRWDIGDNPVAIRRKEDEQATKIVGAKTRYFDLPDCIYRVANGEALYPTEDSLWENIHPDDPAITALETLKFENIDMLYAPMGVGLHVDHLIVRNRAWELAQSSTFQVQFYVEYPYLRNRQSVEEAIEYFPATLTLKKRSFSEIGMQHKIKAMSAYTSQIKSFWSDESDIDSEVRQTFSEKGQFVEEYAFSTLN